MTKTEILLAKNQKTQAKSRIITLFAIKFRNQCNLIITQRFAIKDMSPERNGEHLLLSHIIPVCSSYFDIGSNKGEWTSYILNNDKNVHTEFHLYEPGIVAYIISSDRFKNIPKVSVY